MKTKDLFMLLPAVIFLACAGTKPVYETRPPEPTFAREVNWVYNPADRGDSFLVAPHTNDLRSLRVYSFSRKTRFVFRNWFRADKAFSVEKRDSLGKFHETFQAKPTFLIWRDIESRGEAIVQTFPEVTFPQLVELIKFAVKERLIESRADSAEIKHKRRLVPIVGNYEFRFRGDTLFVREPGERFLKIYPTRKPSHLVLISEDEQLIRVDLNGPVIYVIPPRLEAARRDPLVLVNHTSYPRLKNAALGINKLRSNTSETVIEFMFTELKDLFERQHDVVCAKDKISCTKHHFD